MASSSPTSAVWMLFVAISLWLIGSLSQLRAADYYMAPPAAGGAYGHPGTIDQPFRTLSQFNDVALPGDTVFLRGGVYIVPETIFTKSGEPARPITIRNYPGEVPILDGDRTNPGAGTNGIVLEDGVYSGVDGPKHHLVFDGLYLRNWKRGGLYFGDVNGSRAPTYISCHDILVQNCVVDYCGQLGIRFTHSDRIEIRNSIFCRTGWDITYGSWSSNINFIENDGKNLKVSGCVGFHAVDVSDYRTDGNGMIMDVHGWTAGQFDPAGVVENCLFFANGGAGIAWTNSNNATIVNNTLYDNGKEPAYVHGRSGLVFWNASDRIVVRNNIIHQPQGQGMKVGDRKAFTNSVFERNNITGQDGAVAPHFLNPDQGDLRLATHSPSRDIGLTTGVPSSSIGLDPRVFKQQTTGQPIAWFHLAPDLDFIISQGGLANCFTPVNRPQGGGIDLGAYEHINASTPPPPVEPPAPGNPLLIQAEAGTWQGSGVGVVTTIPDFQGTGAIGNFANAGDTLAVTFPNVDTGTYLLKIRYQVWSPQQNAWVLNGVATDVSWPANADNAGTWAMKEIPITLTAGAPTIGIARNYGYIIIDSFELVPTAVNAPANVAPTVALTAPANNTTVTLPTTVTLTATATDSDGTVAKVEFFAGATKIGEDLTSPYSLTWSSPTVGAHQLTARATDNAGAVTTSASMALTVHAPANVAPTVTLTAPISGTTVTLPTTVTLTATASDSDGTVTKVEFFAGATKIGEDANSPYSHSWENPPTGTHSLTARATDNLGATTTSATRSFTVHAAAVSPPPSAGDGTGDETDGEEDGGDAGESCGFGSSLAVFVILMGMIAFRSLTMPSAHRMDE